MPLFDVPSRNIGKGNDKKLLTKAKSAKKSSTTVRGGQGVLGRITEIKSMVEKHLGKYKDEYIVIQDVDTLSQYIDKCINNHVISIDTETTGLDPLVDKCVGICIYTPGEKAAYIPLNHVSYVTGMPVEGQLDVKIVCEQFNRMVTAHIDVIMFNAKFDIRVLRNQVGLKDIYCTWDCYLAARIMNENEPTSGLKALHKKYILNGKGDAFSFDNLFNGITFDKIPINTGYLYAAHDAIITYELYKYQKKFVYYDPSVTPEYRNAMYKGSV